MKPIFSKEREEFLKLWHAYHCKYQIPYNYDDAKDFFLKLTVIFREGEKETSRQDKDGNPVWEEK